MTSRPGKRLVFHGLTAKIVVLLVLGIDLLPVEYLALSLTGKSETMMISICRKVEKGERNKAKKRQIPDESVEWWWNI
jgi:hypothetical protein